MSDSARDRLRKILNYGGSDPKPPPSSTTPQAPTPSSQNIPRRPPSPEPMANPTKPPSAADPGPVPSPQQTTAAAPVELRSSEHHVPPSQDALPTTPSELRLFLQELRAKMAQLAEDFAKGKLNRLQFQEIYAHYQRQRQSVEAALVNAAGPESLRASVSVGMTSLLRERHAAKILSYAIYDNESSLPLASVGTFRIDTSLLVPMLSSFRSAATEMFGAGLRSTEIEGGHWLCFVPGEFSTLMVLFSVEPARVQLTLIEDLHRDFEVANRAALKNGRGREAAELFTRIWALDKARMY